MRLLSCHLRFIAVVVASCAGVAGLFGMVPDAFQSATPFTAARDFARREGWTGRGAENTPAVTYLITLYEGGTMRQWLAHITETELTPAERTAGLPDEIRHTTTGRRLAFARTPRALRVLFCGEFRAVEESVPRRTSRRVVIARESLATGFVDFARDALDRRTRVESAGFALSPYWAMRRPLSRSVVEEGRKQADRIGLSEAGERRICDVIFALIGMYEAATTVPPFKEVLERVIEKPSAWSVIRGGGLNTTLTFPWHGIGVDPKDGATPPALFQLPVQLNFNGRCALQAWLAVERPHPPLDLSGGIRGAVAQHPNKPELWLRVDLLTDDGI